MSSASIPEVTCQSRVVAQTCEMHVVGSGAAERPVNGEGFPLFSSPSLFCCAAGPWSWHCRVSERCAATCTRPLRWACGFLGGPPCVHVKTITRRSAVWALCPSPAEPGELPGRVEAPVPGTAVLGPGHVLDQEPALGPARPLHVLIPAAMRLAWGISVRNLGLFCAQN